MINENYLLLLNINPENNILELNKIYLIKDENNSIDKKECLLECKMSYNNLYYWKDLNFCLLIQINSNSEIIKIKNILSEEDFSKLFIYDLLSKRLKTFSLIDIHHVYKYKENELFYFHLNYNIIILKK